MGITDAHIMALRDGLDDFLEEVNDDVSRVGAINAIRQVCRDPVTLPKIFDGLLSAIEVVLPLHCERIGNGSNDDDATTRLLVKSQEIILSKELTFDTRALVVESLAKICRESEHSKVPRQILEFLSSICESCAQSAEKPDSLVQYLHSSIVDLGDHFGLNANAPNRLIQKIISALGSNMASARCAAIANKAEVALCSITELCKIRGLDQHFKPIVNAYRDCALSDSERACLPVSRRSLIRLMELSEEGNAPNREIRDHAIDQIKRIGESKPSSDSCIIQVRIEACLLAAAAFDNALWLPSVDKSVFQSRDSYLQLASILIDERLHHLRQELIIKAKEPNAVAPERVSFGFVETELDHPLRPALRYLARIPNRSSVELNLSVQITAILKQETISQLRDGLLYRTLYWTNDNDKQAAEVALELVIHPTWTHVFETLDQVSSGDEAADPAYVARLRSNLEKLGIAPPKPPSAKPNATKPSTSIEQSMRLPQESEEAPDSDPSTCWRILMCLLSPFICFASALSSIFHWIVSCFCCCCRSQSSEA